MSKRTWLWQTPGECSSSLPTLGFFDNLDSGVDSPPSVPLYAPVEISDRAHPADFGAIQTRAYSPAHSSGRNLRVTSIAPSGWFLSFSMMLRQIVEIVFSCGDFDGGQTQLVNSGSSGRFFCFDR